MRFKVNLGILWVASLTSGLLCFSAHAQFPQFDDILITHDITLLYKEPGFAQTASSQRSTMNPKEQEKAKPNLVLPSSTPVRFKRLLNFQIHNDDQIYQSGNYYLVEPEDCDENSSSCAGGWAHASLFTLQTQINECPKEETPTPRSPSTNFPKVVQEIKDALLDVFQITVNLPLNFKSNDEANAYLEKQLCNEFYPESCKSFDKNKELVKKAADAFEFNYSIGVCLVTRENLWRNQTQSDRGAIGMLQVMRDPYDRLQKQMNERRKLKRTQTIRSRLIRFLDLNSITEKKIDLEIRKFPKHNLGAGFSLYTDYLLRTYGKSPWSFEQQIKAVVAYNSGNAFNGHCGKDNSLSDCLNQLKKMCQSEIKKNPNANVETFKHALSIMACAQENNNVGMLWEDKCAAQYLPN